MKEKMLLFAVVLWIFIGGVVQASGNVNGLTIESSITGYKVTEELNSILQIVVVYETEDGEIIPIQSGSGFLIGKDDSELQTVITTKDVVTVPDSMKEQIKETYAEGVYKDVSFQIKVVVDKDVMIDAVLSASSNEMNYAILHLNQPLHDRTALYIYDKNTDKCLRQDAYVVGYPTAVLYEEEPVYYTKSQAVITQGFMESEEEIDGAIYYKHHIFPGYGNIGGPILDCDNNIIALNQGKNDGKNFYALEIDEIIPVLDSLGIPYKKITELEEELQKESESRVYKENLKEAVSLAESLKLDGYTKKSVRFYLDAMEEAKVVLCNEDATQKEVNDQIMKLESAKKQLTYKPNPWIIVGIVVGCVLIIICVFLIIMILTKDKRLTRKAKKKEAFTVTEPAPIFDYEIKNHYDSYKELVDAGNGIAGGNKIWNMRGEETFMTSVLNASLYKNNVEELSTMKSNYLVMLVRMDSGEQIGIDKFPFVIGKDRTRTDYEIKNNPVVSRVHAILKEENGRYYIIDQKSSNGTYVNSLRLMPGMMWELKNHDQVVFANALYVFICK